MVNVETPYAYVYGRMKERTHGNAQRTNEYYEKKRKETACGETDEREVYFMQNSTQRLL